MPSLVDPSISGLPTIPPDIDVTDDERAPRTLILCFDGTASQYDGDNTNVVTFYSLLKKDDDFAQQLCYYQPGIGTYFNPGMVSPIFQWGAKILDEAFAWYLDAHVRGGYQFLMQNYVAGDKICIFGFSRGAYTARALAGMLHKIGLLPRDNLEQTPFAYKLYKNTDAESVSLAAGFKQTFCRDVKIEFVGVWETVASVGVIMERSLPFTTSNTTIKTFRHALSLDEHRVRFLPNLYHRPVPGKEDSTEAGAGKQSAPEKGASATSPTSETPARAEGKTTVKQPTASPKKQRSLKALLRRWSSKQKRNAATAPLPKVKQHHGDIDVEAGQSSSSESSASTSSTSPSSALQPLDDDVPGGTDVLEVWFAGCHGDVGGGGVPNDTKLSLSDVTLRWMVREVVLAQCAVEFDKAALVRANIPESIFKPPMTVPAEPDAKGNPDSDLPPGSNPSSSSGSGSGSDPLDVEQDALQPIHDALTDTPLWWLLEIIPASCTFQDASGNWVKKWWFPGHLGRGREIPDIKPKFHVTVRQRMQDPNLQYKPRAVWTAGTETYVQ